MRQYCCEVEKINDKNKEYKQIGSIPWPQTAYLVSGFCVVLSHIHASNLISCMVSSKIQCTDVCYSQ